ncbi:site-2 protease family protein [Trebonia sp.]|uniref:site-2 protease family protein n=1 Tax=Trebonia sp. TaxID=2767075 RepID=UPI0026174B32|nr:site-2 protease family protein [Trebonia sp.]
MRPTFSLGQISGIRIGVNWSVLAIVALLAYGLAVGQFPAEVPHRPEAEYVAAGLVTAVVYMGSLLVHELSHSLVARRNGVKVEDITLWLLGGVSRLEGEFPDPGAELRVAGAGPLASLLLGGLFLLVTWLAVAAGARGVVVAALAWLGGINIVLAVFNVIPAAPLDGGRLLQAVLWSISKDKIKAASWSARSGQVFGWVLVVAGFYLVLVQRDYSWLWFVLLGWFLISAATAENQQAVLQSRLRTVAVREIMTANPATVPASATVAQFLNDYLPWHRHSAFPVVDDGQTVGLITVHRANRVPAGERAQTSLRDAACPLSDVAQATPDEPVADVLSRLNECSERRTLVLQDGHLAGIVSPADISRALGQGFRAR